MREWPFDWGRRGFRTAGSPDGIGHPGRAIAGRPLDIPPYELVVVVDDHPALPDPPEWRDP